MLVYEKAIAVYCCDTEVKEHNNCIYCYINKVNNKRYVGQAKSLRKRHYGHIKNSSNKSLIDKALKKHGLHNFDLLVLKENLSTQCVLNLHETYYIKKINALVKHGMGYNLADGGHNGNTWAGKSEEELKKFKQKMSELNKGRKRPREAIESQRTKIVGERNGFYGKKHTEEVKKLISEMASQRVGELNPFYGKTHTEEVKQKISEQRKGKCVGKENPFYGKTHTEEVKQKISETNRGRCLGENSPFSKRVARYDLQGNFIDEWIGTGEAARQLKINQPSISAVCRGKLKKAGEYMWRYINEHNEDTYKNSIKPYTKKKNIVEKGSRTGAKNGNAKAIVQLDKNNNFIKVWGSAADVERELGINSTSVRGCCRGKNKTASGYIWKYADE